MKCPRKCQRYLIIALVLNVIVLIVLSYWTHVFQGRSPNAMAQDTEGRRYKNSMISHNKEFPLLTIIIQDFESFENQVSATIKYMLTNFSDVNILVISDTIPYPPLLLTKSDRVKLVTLNPSPDKYLNSSRPDYFINSKYVLFVPDGVVISKHFMENYDKIASILNSKESIQLSAVALGVDQNSLSCENISVSLKLWTLTFHKPAYSVPNKRVCNYILGDHGLLLRTKDLNLLSYPFSRPTFTSLYLQFNLKNMTTYMLGKSFLQRIDTVFKEPQNQWKHKQLENDRVKFLYTKFGIKRVVHSNGKVEWHGCTRESFRCFDTVFDDMPEYLYHGRWTPPCCLKALRETAKHVFSILDKCKVRYWLEGGSLLGAARHKDIIPWDYDIDIGTYKDDIIRCTQLAKLSDGPFTDNEGFAWEKAREGEFYRVQYSETNHLHVDIFPFYSRDGVMTKNTWFKTHRQDTEFPERFLKPLTIIEFAGLNASAPNNVREFLEYKFGPGVIENPKYPNAVSVYNKL